MNTTIRHRRALAGLLGILAAGCGSTGQAELRYAIVAAGRAPEPVAAGAWTLTFDVARVWLGPMYFCATAAASSSLCPAAVQEFPSAAEFDALSPASQPLGFVTGVTGVVRSASYDFGLTWFATQRQVTPAPGNGTGRSAHFEGRATRGDRAVRFVLDVRAVPMAQGAQAVQGARAQAELRDGRALLTVRVDALAWWRAVDFDEVADAAEDPVVIPASSRIHNAVVVAMTAGAPPRFEWSTP